jgi:hypothetical protein
MARSADDDIRQDINETRQDIDDTRSAMTEKLEILEERVQETVDSVKHTFDLHYQVKQRPWVMFGASLLVGYMLGSRGSGSVSSAIASIKRRSPWGRDQQTKRYGQAGLKDATSPGNQRR